MNNIIKVNLKDIKSYSIKEGVLTFELVKKEPIKQDQEKIQEMHAKSGKFGGLKL